MTGGRRNAMIAVAVLAVAVGIAVAILTSGHGSGHHHRQHASAHTVGELSVAASYLGIGTTTVRERLRKGESLGQVAQARAGKSASGLVQALLASRLAQIKAEGLSPAREQARIAHTRTRLQAQVERRRRSGDLVVAASYLSMAEAELRARLREGRTLAQVAAARGRPSSGLASALLSAKREKLHVEAESGAIAKAQEQQSLATLPARVSKELHRKLLQAEARS